MTVPSEGDRHRAGAVRVAERLRDAGYEAWLAGGCVRDLLLGRAPKDWDIATDARPDEVQALFDRTVAVGAAFGVVQVLERGGRSYEVATFRADGEYVDGRRPSEVHYSRSREDDVRRRDFTINALLMDPVTGEILDYVGGRADLGAGIIRAVGAARERLTEDRLRMLRAVRFAARLGFAIEPETWRAIEREAPYLGVVSPERITQELEGIWTGPRPGDGERLLERSGLARVCLPEDRPKALSEALDRLPQVPDLGPEDRAAVGWALVHAHLGRPELEPALRARKLSRRTMRAVDDCLRAAATVDTATDVGAEVLRLVRSPDGPRRRAYLFAAHGEGSPALDRWDAAAGWLERHPPAPEALLTGADLKALSIPPGPGFKRILDAVEAAALEGRSVTREDALAVAREAAGLEVGEDD